MFSIPVTQMDVIDFMEVFKCLLLGFLFRFLCTFLDMWTIITWYLVYFHNLVGIYHNNMLSLVRILT
jgi:hypothetical protein